MEKEGVVLLTFPRELQVLLIALGFLSAIFGRLVLKKSLRVLHRLCYSVQRQINKLKPQSHYIEEGYELSVLPPAPPTPHVTLNNPPSAAVLHLPKLGNNGQKIPSLPELSTTVVDIENVQRERPVSIGGAAEDVECAGDLSYHTTIWSLDSNSVYETIR